MNELDRVRSRLCSFWKCLIKWIHKKIPKNRNIQGPYLLLVNDAVSTSVLTQPSAPEQPCFLEMKAAERPRNAFLMWYPLVFIVKIGRDINNTTERNCHADKSIWQQYLNGKQPLRSAVSYPLLKVISMGMPPHWSQWPGTPRQFTEGKKACQNCHSFSCFCHPLIWFLNLVVSWLFWLSFLMQ